MIYGLNTSYQQAALVYLPIPWDVTTSYGKGTANGPEAILQASPQLDLYDIELGEFYHAGLHWQETHTSSLKELNTQGNNASIKVITAFNNGTPIDGDELRKVNSITTEMLNQVYELSLSALKDNKLIGLVGGDHSSPLGLIKALSEQYDNFGILHIDAHADLRDQYQGFVHSHASIMKNALGLPKAPRKLVQVGIRDFCLEEKQLIDSDIRISTYFDFHLKEQLFNGTTWHQMCQKVISELPEHVYISFDIDGLSPEFCPSTGTPVPGGLNFDQASYLISQLGQSGKKIIGFDLNEVAPSQLNKSDEWDGNVGARLLFKLTGWTLKSNNIEF